MPPGRLAELLEQTKMGLMRKVSDNGEKMGPRGQGPCKGSLGENQGQGLVLGYEKEYRPFQEELTFSGPSVSVRFRWNGSWE